MKVARRSLIACAAGLLATMACAAPVEVNDQNFQDLRKLLTPDPKELAWQTIPWRASLWSAALEADRTSKPILLWAMNGHPLACT